MAVLNAKQSDATNLYEEAARRSMEIGDFASARRWYYECGDFDGVMLALEKDKAVYDLAASHDLLIQYMTECPAHVRARHPYALLAYAKHLFDHQEYELFRKTCDELEEIIHRGNIPDSAQRDRLLGEFELLLGFTEFKDLKKVSQRYKKAWEHLNQPASALGAEIDPTFGSPSMLGLYYRESGRLLEHIADMKDAMPYFTRLTKGQGAGAEDVMEAENRFNRGDLEGAESCAQRALSKARAGKDEGIAVSAQYFQVLSAFMKGDLDRLVRLMGQMHECLSGIEDSDPIHTVEICEGCIYAYLDQLDEVPKRLLRQDPNDPRLRFPAYPFFNVMYGRLLLLRGEYVKLIGSAERFFSVASVFSNLLGYIYTYIYLAAAYRSIHREEEAILSLQEALAIAMPDKQYMLFAENCDYIGPLLHMIADRGAWREEIREILKLGEIFANSKARALRRYEAQRKPPLTRRETEIARLAAQGMTNPEIGRQLFISPNTVKMALKSVYSKLSVGSRVLLKERMDSFMNKE
jgi:LuxR family maltose regulon positive regulatory protein